MRFSHFAAQTVTDRKRIKQLEMRMRTEKRLLISLPVNVDEKLAQLTQERMRSELVVDEDLVASRRRELAPHDQLFTKIHAGVFQQPFEIRIGANEEQALDRSPF